MVAIDGFTALEAWLHQYFAKSGGLFNGRPPAAKGSKWTRGLQHLPLETRTETPILPKPSFS